MRTTEQLRSDLSRLTLQHMGFDGAEVDQQTDEWERMKLGVISGSRVAEMLGEWKRAPFPADLPIVAGSKRGENTVEIDGKSFTGTKQQCIDFVRDHLPKEPPDMRTTYMLELMAEVITKDRRPIKGKPMDWGNEHEESCIGWYEFDSGATVDSIPFVYKDDTMRAGCSPDGLIGDRMGIEAKNPWNTAVYLAFALDGKIKPEYVEQVQFSMWVTGREQWVFACHDPRVLNYCAHSVVIDRDEAKMRLYDDAVPAFVAEMDLKLAKLGYKFGDQWQF